MSEASSFYVTGGTLAQDALCYVERAADGELLEGLRRGEFCYVLTSRQMGKSSLMVRTAARLREEGVRVAVLDLTQPGRNVTAEQWYYGLLTHVGHQLGLAKEVREYWLAQSLLSPLQRWIGALEQVVLGAGAHAVGSGCSAFGVRDPDQPELNTEHRTAQRAPDTGHRLVIFIDEIDTVLSLPFSVDEFFSGIRECYNRRAQEPAFHRLTFCLLGVATPADLIRDPRTTPFNIGRRIEVGDFTHEEAAPLAIGLVLNQPGAPERHLGAARALLGRVLHWTGGHPYLTQRLCQAIADDPLSRVPRFRISDFGSVRPVRPVGPVGRLRPARDLKSEIRNRGTRGSGSSEIRNPKSVDELCRELFLRPGLPDRDDNLRFVRDGLLRVGVESPSQPEETASRLDLYRRVRTGRRVRDATTDPRVAALRLAGIVRAEQGLLRVRNRIYARVFDREWIDDHMPDAERRRQRAAYRQGLARGGALAAVILAVMTGLSLTALDRARFAREMLAQTLIQRGVHQLADPVEGDARGLLDLLAAYRAAAGSPEWQRAAASLWAAWYPSAAGRLADMVGHDSPVRCVAFRRADGLLATGADDGSLRFWARDAARECWEPAGGPLSCGGPVTRAVFSADGRRLAVVAGAALSLWNVADRQRCGPPLDRGEGWLAVAFSPDGRFLASNGSTRLKVWRVDRGRLPVLVFDPAFPARTLAFSPDGRSLAAGSDREARVWRSGPPALGPVARGTRLRVAGPRRAGARSLPHDGSVYTLAFSPDGRLLTTGSGSELRVWRVATGRPHMRPLRHAGRVSRADFSPEGTLLAARTRHGLHLWNMVTGAPHGPPIPVPATGGGVVFLPHNGGLIGHVGPGGVRLWKSATLEPYGLPLRSESVVNAAAVAPGGRFIAAGLDDGSVRIWRTQVPPEPGHVFDHRVDIAAMALARDGMTLLTVGFDGWLRQWRTATGMGGGNEGVPARGTHRRGTQRSWVPVAVDEGGVALVGHAANNAVFSSDGDRLATWTGARVDLWDLERGPRRAGALLHPAPLTTALFSAEGGRLATACLSGVRLWESDTGRAVGGPLAGGAGSPWLAFSGDGLALAAARSDRVTLWTMGDGSRAVALQHPAPVTALAISPDGRWLASAGATREAGPGGVRLWEVRSGRKVGPTLPHPAPVTRMVFDRTSRRLATTGEDAVVRVWSVPGGRDMGPPLRHPDAVYDVRFSPDGGALATAAADGGRLWDAWTGEPLGPPLRQSARRGWVAFSADGRLLLYGAGSTVRLQPLPRPPASLAEMERRTWIALAARYGPRRRLQATRWQEWRSLRGGGSGAEDAP